MSTLQGRRCRPSMRAHACRGQKFKALPLPRRDMLQPRLGGQAGGRGQRVGSGLVCQSSGTGIKQRPAVHPLSHRVAALLARLEGQAVNYTAFARGTPPGKDCVCRLLRARAWRATLPGEAAACRPAGLPRLYGPRLRAASVGHGCTLALSTVSR